MSGSDKYRLRTTDTSLKDIIGGLPGDVIEAGDLPNSKSFVNFHLI